MDGLPRRRLLTCQSSFLTLGALAGCLDGDDASPETTDGTGTGDSHGTDDLDLREANVVAVAAEDGDGSYAFDVTLHHDDDGEDGFVDWWQVERLDGSRLGRRELLHAHSRQPFTRSETIEIPGEVTCVVVRGHDRTHGYGGVAMLVDLESGATRRVDQGTEPRSFDASDCP
ncbi:hypothetical protein [Haloarchaeobius iranensis]|uniref:Uncharacterized protein n=1 Tax=Haloarchaeobius iranensis TaxID=996166 RepID=A0A1G9V4D8_9EURY|nr:hypothetical protein [Haloarchaeobius iranensis]SDM66953.1 hypothetical protein SAMN05192554_105182 [Haloarchaeobius iranensis]